MLKVVADGAAREDLAGHCCVGRWQQAGKLRVSCRSRNHVLCLPSGQWRA